MWRKTLVYLGLIEEPDEYDEMPERFEEQARAARPAMHDTTGPISVVRPDGQDDFGLGAVAARASGGTGSGGTGSSGSGFRSTAASGDLTEPVGRVRGDAPSGGGGGAAAGAGGGTNVRALRPDDGGGQSMPGGLGRRVAIVAVTDYEESAREVGTRFRQGSPVIFDLTDAPTEARKRVLDFVAGTIFALNGEMMKVGAKSFLVVPRGTDIPEREWMRLEALGYRP